MSNIVIQEYDYTTAGNAQYYNFGVVVPGFVAENKSYADVIAALDRLGLTLDENGVIEFTYATDFKQVVGCGNRTITATTVAEKPVAQNLAALPTERYSISDYTEYKNIIAAYPSQVYGFSLAAPTATPTIGKLKLQGTVKYHEESASTGYFEFISDEADAENPEYSAGATYINDTNYTADITFEAFPAEVDNENVYNGLINYRSADHPGKYNMPVLILTGNEGTDSQEITGRTYYGNQFAYELLGLGYPVLYKLLNKIDYSDPNNPEFSPTEIEDITSDAFWQPLADRSVYDFRYIITGLLDNNNEANNAICKLAAFSNQATTGRGDVIALCDVDKAKYLTDANITQLQAAKKIAKAAAEINNADKFSGIFAPTVEYAYSNANYNNAEFSGAFHYLMCASSSINNNFREWFANSGYQRGVGRFTVVGTPGVKLGDQAVKYLQPRVITNGVTKAVNLIIKIKDSYYLWGNRTAHPLDSVGLKASHFLNIRQLCTTLNKTVYEVCKKFTYEPNSYVLWVNFKNAIRPTLEAMKTDQGIEDYQFILLPSRQKAELRAQIKIVPIEAVEDFYIGIALVDSIEDVTVAVTEN